MLFLNSILKIKLFQQVELSQNTISDNNTFLLIIFFAVIAVIVLSQFYKFFEQIYVNKKSKPFYIFNHLYKRKLKGNQLKILETKFDFYKKLSNKHKRNFQHRVACFIREKEFYGRENLIITDEMKVLVSATAVMLTFGFRKYLIEALDTIIIYPEQYYSKQSDRNHKGEYNPMMKALVLSWEDFLEGYNIGNDNLNLGIHEVVHAIHFNSFKEVDISSYLFKNKFLDLTDFLQKNPQVRAKLIEAKYFREYAFTNQFEFTSVLIESFFETPKEFKSHFPMVYKYIKQMLNFDFAGY